MKKILIALMIVVSMLAITACGKADSDSAAADASATDASATDASNTDATPTDAIPAPEGFTGCIVGDIYFCYPEDYKKADVSATDTVTVSASGNTGANFSVTKSKASETGAALLSKSDLDAIGEKGAADLGKVFGSGVKTAYTYVDSGSFLEDKGTYFDFDITVEYVDAKFTQTLNYRQIYVGKGTDIYVFTFASNTSFGDSAASEYFADVIGSIAFNEAE